MTPKLRPGMFVDPPATLQRKPTAAPTVTPQECIAMALTAADWKPGGIIDPDGIVVQSIMRMIEQAGWEIVPKVAKRAEDGE